MHPPLVSVLIGAYNAEPWIADTVASAVGQTHPAVEVVVVDDGSTDGTLAILRGLEADHPGVVQVIAQENRGACAARNRALAAARGEYVQYLDADDLLHPDKIRLQLARLRDAPARSVATGPWVRFADAVPLPERVEPGPDWRDYAPATDWLLQSWGGNGTIPSFSWLLPRALVEEAGPWTEGLLRNQDGEYFARILVRATGILFCAGAWGFYRTTGGSVSSRRSDAALASLFRSYQLCEQALLSTTDTPRARRACAGLWQSFAQDAYPQVPELVARAEARARSLGGWRLDRKPRGGRAFELVRDLAGWKAALRLRRAVQRVRTVGA